MGFSDRDYSDTRRPRRHRSFGEPVPVYRWVQRARLSEATSRHPELVDNARSHLSELLDRHAEECGLTVLEVNWASFDYNDPHIVEIELSAKLAPRTDGEWASIRAAIEEDQADRDEALHAERRVSDRLDALRESVGVWTAKTPEEVRAAVSAPSRPARLPFPLNRPPS